MYSAVGGCSVHSFNKNLLRVYYLLSIVLGDVDMAVNEETKILALLESISRGSNRTQNLKSGAHSIYNSDKHWGGKNKVGIGWEVLEAKFDSVGQRQPHQGGGIWVKTEKRKKTIQLFVKLNEYLHFILIIFINYIFWIFHLFHKALEHF